MEEKPRLKALLAMNTILTTGANKIGTDYPMKMVPSPLLFVFKTGT